MGRVFPFIRLRASGSTSICPLPLGPVVVFSLGAGGLFTGGSSGPVMSSYEKSPHVAAVLPALSCVP